MLEYSGHLIPEAGYHRLPQVFADGAVVVGGGNFIRGATFSGKSSYIPRASAE